MPEESLTNLSPQEISTMMLELYTGLLGGRKFNYQFKLCINKGVDIMQDPMLGQMVHAL